MSENKDANADIASMTFEQALQELRNIGVTLMDSERCVLWLTDESPAS